MKFNEESILYKLATMNNLARPENRGQLIGHTLVNLIVFSIISTFILTASTFPFIILFLFLEVIVSMDAAFVSLFLLGGLSWFVVFFALILGREK